MSQVEILERRDGEYRVRVQSFDGAAELTLTLGDVVAAYPDAVDEITAPRG